MAGNAHTMTWVWLPASVHRRTLTELDTQELHLYYIHAMDASGGEFQIKYQES